MKNSLLAILFFGLITTVRCQETASQDEQRYFRPGYVMLGLNLPNGDFKNLPFYNLNAKENFLAGAIGEQTGFLLQKGRIFYFNSRNNRLRAGLDWTMLSFTYNSLNWKDYSTGHGGTTATSFIVGASTRIGPAITYNPVEKLTISAHFQVAPTIELTGFEYSRSGSGGDDEALSLVTKSVFQNTGFKTNFGVYVRWGIFGLGFDYVSGGVDYHYQYTNQQTGEGGGGDVSDAPVKKQKLSSPAFEIKLVL